MQYKSWKRWIFVDFIILINVILWLIPSDIVQLIARDRNTLLGRYSEEKFMGLVLMAFFSCIAIYLVLWITKENAKKKLLQIVTLLVTMILGLFLGDLFLRYALQARYVRSGDVYHRPPSQKIPFIMRDKPEVARSYPRVPAGYPDIRGTITTDPLGFRNTERKERYDVVTIGDSFTEGSHVSDEHPWPVLFAQKSGLSVYNLGMSGTDIPEYLKTFEQFGVNLSPKTLICMVYEGNDFRASGIPEDRERSDTPNVSSNQVGQEKQREKDISKDSPPPGNRRQIEEGNPTLARKMRNYWKNSPLVMISRKALIRYLAPIGANNEIPGGEVFSWMPIGFPEGENKRHYAFAPKGILDLYQTRKNFEQSVAWQVVAWGIERLKKICDSHEIRLLIVYAPTKAHTVLPLIKDNLPADKLRRFASLRKSNLPASGDEFAKNLYDCLDVQETVVSDFCKRNDIEFLSTTNPLRQSMSQGQQVYFSYDQHWTPPGHEVVAETIHQYWQKSGENK